MPDNTANRVAPILCWVMQPALDKAQNPDFQWNWTRWQMTGRIIAGSARRTTSAKGNATFKVVRETRMEPTDTKRVIRSDDVYVGSYVAITTGKLGDVISTGSLGLKPESILWWGWVTSFDAEIFKGTTESVGSVSALEVGHLFDRMQVVGWSRKAADSAYPEPLQSPPTANIAGPTGQVIGNAFPGTDASGNPVYLFARTAEDCGVDPLVNPGCYWTRWRLLRHLVKVAKPKGLPDLSLIPQGETVEPVDPSDATKLAGYINVVAKGTPEVFNLAEPTFCGHLDLLLPRSLALGWRVAVDRSSWKIVPYSLAASNEYGLPANMVQQNIDLSDDDGNQVVSVGRRETADDLPDQVILDGGRCVFAGTVGFPDNTMKIGWNNAQETTYKNGAKAATDYSGLSTDNKKSRNRAIRSVGHNRDVFTRFVLNHTNNGDITFLSPPGDAGSALSRPLCPDVSVDNDGVTVRVNASVSRAPYLPTATLLRTLPWPEGIQSNGIDPRDADAKAQPVYLTPRVYRYDKSNVQHPWIDLIADNGASSFFPVSIEPDDHGPAMHVSCHPQEGFAKGHWTGAEVGDIDPDNTSSNAISYGSLVFTIAIESDQVVRHVITRPGVNPNSPRRQLHIVDGRYQFWAVHVNTIVGLKADGTPDRVLPPTGSGYYDGNNLVFITRNDWPALVRRAKQIAAFAFRSRVALSITFARPDAPPDWAEIGTMLGDVIEAPATTGDALSSFTANTVIEEIAFDFGAAPRVTINTNLPDALSGTTGGPGADRGGGVSVSGEGTLAQRTQRIDGTASGLARATERIPTTTPVGGTSAAHVYQLVIDRGNTLSDGTTLGIKLAGSAISTVPSIYDPNVTSAFIDGIGRATLYVDGVAQSGFVLVVHDGRTGDQITVALVAGDVPFATAAPVTIPLSGDPTQSVTCYVPAYQ